MPREWTGAGSRNVQGIVPESGRIVATWRGTVPREWRGARVVVTWRGTVATALFMRAVCFASFGRGTGDGMRGAGRGEGAGRAGDSFLRRALLLPRSWTSTLGRWQHCTYSCRSRYLGMRLATWCTCQCRLPPKVGCSNRRYRGRRRLGVKPKIAGTRPRYVHLEGTVQFGGRPGRRPGRR